MKRLFLLLPLFILSLSARSQHTIPIRNLWAEPQVHVLFEGYTVSFLIKDIDRALYLLAEAGDSTFGTSAGLDTAKHYNLELYSGYRTQYRDRLQPLLQKGVGAYLLYRGHAVVENAKHKKLKSLTIDMVPMMDGLEVTDVKFFDPYTGKLVFNGQMPDIIRNADLGIE